MVPADDGCRCIGGIAEPSGHSRDGHFPAPCGFDPPWHRVENRLKWEREMRARLAEEALMKGKRLSPETETDAPSSDDD